MIWRIVHFFRPHLYTLYLRLARMPVPNYKGDREVEYSFIAASVPDGTGKQALDFGSGPSYMGLIAARKGYTVTAIDLRPISFWYEHPHHHFRQGDLLRLSFEQSFDLIINCSSVEHVGLCGRYGIDTPLPDGDLQAMQKLRSLLQESGRMILTIPVGQDRTYPGTHRVYGKERLPRLLQGWSPVREEFWIKNAHNKWILTSKEHALSLCTSSYHYALGLFLLQKDPAL